MDQINFARTYWSNRDFLSEKHKKIYDICATTCDTNMFYDIIQLMIQNFNPNDCCDMVIGQEINYTDHLTDELEFIGDDSFYNSPYCNEKAEGEIID